MLATGNVGENALTLLILISLGFIIYSNMRGGKIKDSLKELFRFDKDG